MKHKETIVHKHFCLSFSLLPSFVVCLSSYTQRRQFLLKAHVYLLFPCVSSHWWVHFPRSVPFCLVSVFLYYMCLADIHPSDFGAFLEDWILGYTGIGWLTALFWNSRESAKCCCQDGSKLFLLLLSWSEFFWWPTWQIVTVQLLSSFWTHCLSEVWWVRACQDCDVLRHFHPLSQPASEQRPGGSAVIVVGSGKRLCLISRYFTLPGMADQQSPKMKCTALHWMQSIFSTSSFSMYGY